MPLEIVVPKTDKREAILQATLDIIAEYGLQNTPMSGISKRAKASAGVIYHYFASKEEILQILHRRIKADMGRVWLASDDAHQPLARRFQDLLMMTFRYSLNHSKEMAFLEQYESLPEIKQQEIQNLSELIDELPTQNYFSQLPIEEQAIFRLIEDLRNQGLLKDLPLQVIREFTFEVALRLARQVSAGQIQITDTHLELIAQACWDAISR